MNESYAEAGCKRKDTVVTYLIRVGLIILAIFFFLFTFQSQILIFLGVLAIAAIIYVFPKLKVEYEYVFCDGQLDFDEIRGGDKRKTLKRIDFENAEICAPSNSHALDSYNYNNVKVIDYTSGQKDAKTYAVIVRDQGTVTKIMFEPSEEMLKMIKYKAPRKIVFE